MENREEEEEGVGGGGRVREEDEGWGREVARPSIAPPPPSPPLPPLPPPFLCSAKRDWVVW